MYWFISCSYVVYKYLKDVKIFSEVIGNIEEGRKAAPQIKFNIECYHVETSSSRDSDGNESTSKTNVITHRAS